MLTAIRMLDRDEACARDGSPGLVTEIRRRLTALDHHVPSFEEIARDLAMSPRTLRRRLRALETSYSEILQGERLTRAESLLLSSKLTVEGIAEVLGYTEPGNFRQAFRRWTGCSPRRYRGDPAASAVAPQAA